MSYRPQDYRRWKDKKIAELGLEGWKAFQKERNAANVIKRNQKYGVDVLRQARRDADQRRRYGISQRDLGEKCEGCGESRHSWLHVDHDHKTGKVRGVLCFNCNGALGQVRDNPDLLRRLATYLEKHL